MRLDLFAVVAATVVVAVVLFFIVAAVVVVVVVVFLTAIPADSVHIFHFIHLITLHVLPSRQSMRETDPPNKKHCEKISSFHPEKLKIKVAGANEEIKIKHEKNNTTT